MHLFDVNNVFSPRPEDMVRLAAPRVSCAVSFFAEGPKNCAGPFRRRHFFGGEPVSLKATFSRPIAPQVGDTILACLNFY